MFQEQQKALCDEFGLVPEDFPPMLDLILAEFSSGGKCSTADHETAKIDFYFDQRTCFLEYNDLATMAAVSRGHFRLAAAWPSWKDGADLDDSTDTESQAE